VKISQSLQADPRELFVIYVAPNATQERLLDAVSGLRKFVRSGEQNFCGYKGG